MVIQKKLLFILMLISALALYGCKGSENTAITGNTIKTVISADTVEIPVSEITSKAKFYSFDYNGIKINYFVVKGSDNKIRTAFDACDVCGGRKGYRQEGNDMVCNNCGRHFDIDSIGTKNRGGGCWPSYLSHEIEDGKIIIQKQELEKGRRFFL